MDLAKILKEWLANGKQLIEEAREPAPDPEPEPNPDQAASDRFWEAWRRGEDVPDKFVTFRGRL